FGSDRVLVAQPCTAASSSIVPVQGTETQFKPQLRLAARRLYASKSVAELERAPPRARPSGQRILTRFPPFRCVPRAWTSGPGSHEFVHSCSHFITNSWLRPCQVVISR